MQFMLEKLYCKGQTSNLLLKQQDRQSIRSRMNWQTKQHLWVGNNFDENYDEYCIEHTQGKLSMDYLAHLKLKSADKDDGFYCAGGIDNSVIENAESKLQIVFTDEYRKFLEQCGSIGLGDKFVFGLYAEHDNDVESGSVLSETKKYREEVGLPNEYIVLESAEDENIFVQMLDNESRNYGVIFSVDILRDRPLTYAKLYDSFVEYFKDIVDGFVDDSFDE